MSNNHQNLEIQKQPEIHLSVIVPVYNEAKTVSEILFRLHKVKDVTEIVVIDDGSTDKSPEILDQLLADQKNFSKLKVFHKKNGGKGSAIRYGLEKITGNYVLIQDSDLEYDPENIELMLAPVKKGQAQVIYGSRFLGPHSNLLFWHRVGNDFLNLMVNLFFDTTLSDMETCYKLLPTKLFRELNIQANKFDLEPEITCKILKRGIKIFEVPITYVGRDFSQGKKITWWDGVEALLMIAKCRLF